MESHMSKMINVGDYLDFRVRDPHKLSWQNMNSTMLEETTI